MDSKFYIADPTNREAPRLVEYVEAKPLPISNFVWLHLGFVMIQVAFLLLILAAGEIPYISGVSMTFSFLVAGAYLRPSLQRRRGIRKARRCLQEGSIIAVPEAIKAPFEAAAKREVGEAENPQLIWKAGFFEVKELLPLIPVLENPEVSNDRKAEARNIIDQKAAKAATKFVELDAAAKDAKTCISNAEADSLLAMYQESDPT